MIEALKGNVFYEHRKDIQKIAKGKNVDVGIATMMFVEDYKSELGDYAKDMAKWQDVIAEYSISSEHYVSELFE